MRRLDELLGLSSSGRLRQALRTAKNALAVGRLAQLHDAAAWTEALGAGGEPLPPERVRALAVELALRGKPLSDPRVTALASPGDLPLALLPLEEQLAPALVQFGGTPGSHGRGAPAPEPVVPDWLPTDGHTHVEGWASVAEAQRPGPLTAAVDPWVERSNGRILVRVVTVGGPGRHAPEALLRALLPLGERVTATPIAPSGALLHLFIAAHGGAYGPDRSDAEARDLAWANLRGLVGGGPATEVAERAARCGFTHIASNGFFDNVFWDLGLAVCDGERLTLVAATDAD